MNDVLTHNEERYKLFIKEKAKRYTRNNWWGNINYHIIKCWINQFPKNSLAPYLLLDNLNIITNNHITASLIAILDQIKSFIFCENTNLTDDELFLLWNEHINNSLFIAAHKSKDSTSSAPIVARKMRDIIPQSIFHISNAESLCSDILKYKIKNVYFLDDFIGTGNQMNEYLEHYFTCNNTHCPSKKRNKCKIKEVMSILSDVNFNIITIAQHIKGIKYLENKYPKLCFLTSNILDNEYDILSKQCTLYIDNNYIKDVKEVIDVFRTKHSIKNKYKLNLSFGFEHGFPNNALEVYWWPKEDWKPLLARLSHPSK